MADGGRPDGGTGGELDSHMAMVQRLDEAGWETGAMPGSEDLPGFYRQLDKLDVGFLEATQRLDLLDERGDIRPGFRLLPHEERGTLVIGYVGSDEEELDTLVDGLVAWGEELEDRQNEALEREEMLPWAEERTDNFLGQLTVPDYASWIDSEVERTGRLREAVIGTVISTAMPIVVAGIKPGEVEERLETLFAHVKDRQDRLIEEGEGREIKPEFDLLDGIGRGVQQELTRRRDEDLLAASA